jgi:RHS repeat-associated protein
LAYDINADGTPDFTRVLDRSQDNLQRDSGWQLKDGTTIENEVAYVYDTAGRLASVTSPAGPFTYAYQANSMGLLSIVTGPAHTVTNTWENTRDVLARKQNAVGAAVISAYDYSVNALGQRTEVAKTGSAFASNRSFAWGYDSLGQVVKADSTAGFNRTYEYDGIGNRKKAADSLTLPATDNYTANALNQYTAVDTINPAYDDDGNATAYPVPAHLSANSTLAWDAENRLISASVNGTITTYLYDSGSRRIAQTTGSATTVYVYDAWNPVAEYAGTTLAKTYTWGLDLSGSLQGAGGVGGLLAVSVGTTSHFPTYDGNGNISEYLDSAGVAVAHYEYDPFGRTTVSTGTKWGDFAHRFSTKPIDYPTGLYYYGYRYFDPATGRWPSRDPIEEKGGINLCRFVGNDGVNAVDILGERSNISVDFSIPSLIPGLNGYVRGDFWKDDCCINGSLFIAAELTPPGFHAVKKIASKLNVHLELAARGGARAEVSYCKGGKSGCLKSKICFRLEALGRAEYRGFGGGGGFTRVRVGAAIEGGAELCLNLCSGEVTFGSDISLYGYLNFGTKNFKRSYAFGGNWGTPTSSVGKWQGGAVLRQTGWCCADN